MKNKTFKFLETNIFKDWLENKIYKFKKANSFVHYIILSNLNFVFSAFFKLAIYFFCLLKTKKMLFFCLVFIFNPFLLLFSRLILDNQMISKKFTT